MGTKGLFFLACTIAVTAICWSIGDTPNNKVRDGLIGFVGAAAISTALLREENG